MSIKYKLGVNKFYPLNINKWIYDFGYMQQIQIRLLKHKIYKIGNKIKIILKIKRVLEKIRHPVYNENRKGTQI